MTNCQDVFLSKSHSYEEINIEHKFKPLFYFIKPGLVQYRTTIN